MTRFAQGAEGIGGRKADVPEEMNEIISVGAHVCAMHLRLKPLLPVINSQQEVDHGNIQRGRIS